MRINVTPRGNPYEVLEQVDTDNIEFSDPAYPMSRFLDGSQEWYEQIKLVDGRTGVLVYLFDADDTHDEDGEPLDPADFPWDYDYAKRIHLDD